MPIEPETEFTLSGVTSNFCMKMDGDTTRAVLGLIQLRPTSTRAGPLACGNGFKTAYLAFANGHVMALELGGSDHAYNAVPQFEHWQGKPNGEWRQIEIDLKQHAGKLMLVEMAYSRNGGQRNYDTMRAEFQANRLMDWTDERIPDGFKVRVWPNLGLDLTKLVDDNQFDAAVQQLAKKGTAYQKEFVLGDAMPQPDRNMDVVQAGVTIAKDLHEAKEVSTPKLERQPSDMTFLLEKGTIDDVRKKLKTVPGVTAPEATGLQLMPLILNLQKTTEAQVRKKYKVRTKEGLSLVDEAELNRGTKREASGAAGPAGPAKKQKK